MQVGDYVRTKQGYIRQIKEIYDHILYYVNLDKSITMERYGKFEPITQLDRDTIDEIIKSSPNIIDLIEVGDYVNGYLVKDIDYAFDDVVMNNKNARIVPYIDCNKNNYIDDIKSIVTKEQFEEMEYKI